MGSARWELRRDPLRVSGYRQADPGSLVGRGRASGGRVLPQQGRMGAVPVPAEALAAPRAGRAVVTKSEMAAREWASGRESTREVGARYGVSSSMVCRTARRLGLKIEPRPQRGGRPNLRAAEVAAEIGR